MIYINTQYFQIETFLVCLQFLETLIRSQGGTSKEVPVQHQELTLANTFEKMQFADRHRA
jgi:hypothetical protein